MEPIKTISKSKLKAHMLAIFRAIEESGETLIVTDHNRPVLKIEPIRSTKSADELFGAFRPAARFYGDLAEPTLEEWEDV